MPGGGPPVVRSQRDNETRTVTDLEFAALVQIIARRAFAYIL